MSEYECPYCGKDMPDGCPHPAVFACCGEIGHAQERPRMTPEFLFGAFLVVVGSLAFVLAMCWLFEKFDMGGW